MVTSNMVTTNNNCCSRRWRWILLHTILHPPAIDTLATAESSHHIIANSLDNLISSSTPRNLHSEPNEQTVSPYFQWETAMWRQRNLESNVTLDFDAFEVALTEASQQQCNLGITATVFDASSKQVYQRTVGSYYNDLSVNGSPFVDGWTGDTLFALYSNSKIFATVLFMVSVVDSGLGYLDEPLYRSFDYLTESDRVGTITPRMIMSHRTGIQPYSRNDISDPLYSCLKNETTALPDCVQVHLLNDSVLVQEPGTVVRYSNDPWYILADLMVRKTGLATLEDILQRYLVQPLNLTSVSYECPLVGSTAAKPHVSWGICGTGHDVPRLIQVLANRGRTVQNDTQFITAGSVQQMFSFQAGIATNADEPLSFAVPLNNCLARTGSKLDSPNALIGYGLGTMITAGVKGQLFVHAATVGGYLVVAPEKYSAYFGFMKNGAFPPAYAWVARIIDRFERASTVRVRNAYDSANDNYDWTDLTPCIDGMFLDTDIVDRAAVSDVSCPNNVTPAPMPTTKAPTQIDTQMPSSSSSSTCIGSNFGLRLLLLLGFYSFASFWGW